MTTSSTSPVLVTTGMFTLPTGDTVRISGGTLIKQVRQLMPHTPIGGQQTQEIYREPSYLFACFGYMTKGDQKLKETDMGLLDVQVGDSGERWHGEARIENLSVVINERKNGQKGDIQVRLSLRWIGDINHNE